MGRGISPLLMYRASFIEFFWYNGLHFMMAVLCSVYAIIKSLALCCGHMGRTNPYLFLVSNPRHSSSLVRCGWGSHTTGPRNVCGGARHSQKFYPKPGADPVTAPSPGRVTSRHLPSHFGHLWPFRPKFRPSDPSEPLQQTQRGMCLCAQRCPGARPSKPTQGRRALPSHQQWLLNQSTKRGCEHESMLFLWTSRRTVQCRSPFPASSISYKGRLERF